MRRISPRMLGSCLLLAMLAGPIYGQGKGGKEDWTDPARFADEIFRLTNAARAANSVPAFRRDARLDKAAVLFSKYMGDAGFLDHVGPDGVTVQQRIVAQGYRPITWGENIAFGPPTPKAVVDGWMNSPAHRANILNPNFKEIGIGVAFVKGQVFMTQDFGTVRGSR
jgi:uncharacterized protein YkwD